MTEKFVAEEEYMQRFGAQQVPFEYSDRVKDEFPECKFFQGVSVSTEIRYLVRFMTHKL